MVWCIDRKVKLVQKDWLSKNNGFMHFQKSNIKIINNAQIIHLILVIYLTQQKCLFLILHNIPQQRIKAYQIHHKLLYNFVLS